ncbi:hypothetical protein F1D05_00915 [Kribbella qitaiheensis]|uniref:Exo-alpha-sialidase n=1 Tax=Kribbella qitaiheensis TaxID=1544730 RepID=A0A7G6WRV6_9ACTN|nr:hypothetical protein [Kribbella qitaiheensis]QNE16721.1 hypothetical protein F1D05_00915 [Kribbella qitaiheensis]
MRTIRALVITGIALVLVITNTAAGQADTVDGGITVSHLNNGGPAYDYTPTVIQQGSVQRIWWCGQAANPSNPSQNTDAILYATYDTATGAQSTPVAVLGPTAGAWDHVFTCNPGVVGGTFSNPLGDGITYHLAMYYVGTAEPDGSANSIGVAFSNDGVTWKKDPSPVVTAANPTPGAYGVAQPTPYNGDGQAGIHLMFWDTTAHHYYRVTSSDGRHFGARQQISENGWPYPSNGTFGYDSQTNSWYVAMEIGFRPASTTGGIAEREAFSYTLYRIPAAGFTSGGAWTELTTIDTDRSGYELNFIPSMVRDSYGNVNIGSYPNITLYYAASNPRPAADASPAAAGASADPNQWDLKTITWRPGRPELPLTRYFSASLNSHIVSTGWVDTTRYRSEARLASLYEAPRSQANRALYACKAGSADYFLSPDATCEGQRQLGLTGYAAATPSAGITVPLYRCRTMVDHFVSTSASCEGAVQESLLGYGIS